MSPEDRSSPVPSPCPALELLGLLLLLGAWLLSLGAALGPWMERQSDLVDLERVELGLWSGCVVQDSVFSCRPHSSLLGLPPPLLLGRGLLLGALLLGAGAASLTVPGLSLVQSPKCRGAVSPPGLKRALRLWGAGLGLVAAALEAGPVSYAGHVTVRRFWEDSVLEAAPRWGLGDGLFCGWASAAVYVLAAAALWTSCRGGIWGGATEEKGGAREQRGGARQEYV